MISIFAKPAFLNTSPNTSFESKEKNYHGRGHLQRVSSMIRGDQIADYLGAKFNPTEGYENDTCIYVKPHIKKNFEDFKFEGKKNYLDIVDGWSLLPLLRLHPEVGVIACSKQDQGKLQAVLNNEVLFIPQHHCNYDNEKRTRKGIKTVGIIGTDDAFEWIPEEIVKGLEERGIKLLKFSKFFSRQDIIDFYKQIDVQLVWRPYRMKLSNPLKLVNAASFGIPTIAYEESVFHELLGCYLPANDAERFLKEIDSLIEDESFYKSISQVCLKVAEDYHVDKVSELYKEL